MTLDVRTLLCAMAFAGFDVTPSLHAADPFDPQTLAAKIDERINTVIASNSETTSEPASDLEFLRRVTLDLTGRIPTVHEAQVFASDQRVNKRDVCIEQLLDRPRHAAHLSRVWRDWLVPELATIPEARYFQTGFEAWLADKFREQTGYDQIVRELISVPLPSNREQAEHVFREVNRPNALAFFAVKEAQPDKLAATATRAFLGIQLECAQCHSHPFAEWTQEQFWNQAAFFSGIERQGNGLFAPLTEDPKRRSISPGEGKLSVEPAYLFGKASPVDPAVGSRVQFAAWLTGRENPYFARSAVNRVWALLFGIGLVQPIDDFHGENPPSHPEILDELANSFIASDYSVDDIFRVLCRTKAYQRSSRWNSAAVPDPRLYTRMLTKGLSADQAWDSLSLAVGWTTSSDERDGAASERSIGRRRFLEQFSPRSWPAEPETSVSQALSLMNGELLNRATNIEQCPTLIAVAETPGWADDERLASLYWATLNRPPNNFELERLCQFVAVQGTEQRAARYEDILWMLLNSSEFRLNH